VYDKEILSCRIKCRLVARQLLYHLIIQRHHWRTYGMAGQQMIHNTCLSMK